MRLQSLKGKDQAYCFGTTNLEALRKHLLVIIKHLIFV